MPTSFPKILAVLTLGCGGCHFFQPPARFELKSASHTGINFNNRITETDSFNVFTFEYIYNGGGVGVGDFNQDGLPDLYFTGNMVTSRLYLNRGAFRFEDVTVPAGVGTTTWCTGVAVVDINQDGRPDLHVATGSADGKHFTPNLFFINQGNNAQGVPTFREAAATMGLDFKGYSTQAAFLDYDRDGDLDAYLLTNAMEVFNRNVVKEPDKTGNARSVDKLFRNDGPGPSGLPIFTDVGRAAGIVEEGWGLGVVVNDLNQDGWPDLYVANDFQSNDLMYQNNGDGTFTNVAATALRHQSHNSMGVDIADADNDGQNDITVVDMLPEDNLRQKTMFGQVNHDRFRLAEQRGYQPQYVRNVLQRNNGNGSFSDVGYWAGMYDTDWSWCPLLADFDNDGRRDLLITNGYRRDITDLDFVAYTTNDLMFGTEAARDKKKFDAAQGLAGIRKPNCLFQNQGELRFANQAAAWGLTQSSYTNGAAYADLDADGDLDLVMNNLNDPAFVYENHTIDKRSATSSTNHFLRVRLVGNAGNREGMGAKVWTYAGRQQQYAEYQTGRGYQGSVEPTLHFGLGEVTILDSVRVQWPSGQTQTLLHLPTNQILTLSEKNATALAVHPPATPPLLVEVAGGYGLRYQSAETGFSDFNDQFTLPHAHSQIGPGLAVGDINGDGREDVVIGGSAHARTVGYVQMISGTFRSGALEDTTRPDAQKPKTAEDTGVLLFDADNDGDLDLYCVSGSTEFGTDSPHYQDRFYRNRGDGIFALDPSALPTEEASGSTVIASDVDHDGDLDLFVGGRVVPRRYPMPPRSYLLQNDGQGHFTDVTPPFLQRIGMVTAALWTDYDRDGWADLALVGEFMPLTFLKNGHGTLTSGQLTGLAHSTGWWNSLVAGDFDNDGDVDYVAGNLGLNSPYRASTAEPVCVYAKDFDQNGALDAVLCRYNQGKEYPTHPRETITGQLASLKKNLVSYAAYGKATFHDLFTNEQLRGATVLRAEQMASCYVENRGGNFLVRPLPWQAQLAPLYGMVATDVDQDGNLDLIAAGNDYATEPLTGRYDAGTGVCLRGDGRGGFAVLSSGFAVNGDAKGMAQLTLANGTSLLLVTQNRDSLRVFSQARETAKTIPVQKNDVLAELTLADGRVRRQEFYWGNTYLSQSSRTLGIPTGARALWIVNAAGQRRRISLSAGSRE